jgi:hypothetical protein
LRGSSELHGWGDSNLYVRGKGLQLTLSTEHRAAPSRDHIPIQLIEFGSALALQVLERLLPEPCPHASPTDRVRQALAQFHQPAPILALRKLCRMRTAAVAAILAELAAAGEVVRTDNGYELKPPLPITLVLPAAGNGNGNNHLPATEP